jgi:hypothetical protein
MQQKRVHQAGRFDPDSVRTLNNVLDPRCKLPATLCKVLVKTERVRSDNMVDLVPKLVGFRKFLFVGLLVERTFGAGRSLVVRLFATWTCRWIGGMGIGIRRFQLLLLLRFVPYMGAYNATLIAVLRACN